MRRFVQCGRYRLHGVNNIDRASVAVVLCSHAFLHKDFCITGSLMSTAVVPLRRLLIVVNRCLFQQRACGTLARTLNESGSSQLSSSDSAVNSIHTHGTLEVGNKNNGSGNTNSGVVNNHENQIPKELTFYDDFFFNEEDVHYLLLREAHIKHGVFLNVPPQLSPNGTPPEVPEVILPISHLERMRGMQLAYEPTHMPPPLHTTGTRQLIIDTAGTVLPGSTRAPAPSAMHPAGASNGALSREGGAAGALALRRLPPDQTMRFHCSACGKAFRLEVSAEQHVKLKHTPTAKATVAVGPGDGEIIEWAEGTGVSSTQNSGVATSVSTTTAKLKTTTNVSAAVSVTVGDEETSKKRPTALAFEAAATSLKAKVGRNQQEKEEATRGETSPGKSTTKTPYSKATLTLPGEELVDELLREIWDHVAAKRDDIPKNKHPEAYVSFASIVEGKADRRKEMEANAKPTARATPEGAAPGIKKPGMLPGGGMIASKICAQVRILPIKELIKKYPNPFGDSPNAVLQELEKEPLNPFIPEEELAVQLQVAREDNSLLDTNVPATTAANDVVRSDDKDAKALEELKTRLRASRPSLKRSALLRRFTCPLCAERAKKQEKEKEEENSVKRNMCESIVPSFRLLDALLDHVDTAHEGEELSEEQLSALYKIQRQSPLHSTCVDDNTSGNNGATVAGNRDGDVKSDKKTYDTQTPLDAVRAASLPELLQSATPPAAVEQKALSVHVRSGSNTVLLGRIADVQHGFLGATAVTQYVLEVDGGDTTSDDSGTEEDVDKELIVIRCMGDNFPVALLKEQVKLGSTVLVQGTLRMNRHIDNKSRRLHAYPFVQVVPPLGCVRVLS